MGARRSSRHDRVVTPRKENAVIWMTFECPQTGQPLRTMQSAAWSAEMMDTLMALHCPKCSQMHMFGRDDAILEMRGRTDPSKVAV
jgi:hypothetical protein